MSQITRDYSMKIIDSAIILTLITAFLYCAGTAYTHGYFGVFFLDSDILERNFHQIIYYGMLRSILILFLIFFFLAVFITIHSGCVTEISRSMISPENNERKTSKFIQNFKLKRAPLTPIEKMHIQRIQKIWFLFFSFIIFIFIMDHIESKGVDAAQNIKKSINEGEYRAVKLDSKTNEKPFALLYCGARYCAALNPNNGNIRYFPQKEHSQFYYNKNTKN